MLSAWLCCATALVACSLTDGDYAPVQVDTRPNLATDGGSRDPAAASCSDGAECCDAVACSEGESCLDGACQAGSIAPDAGACSGEGCAGPIDLAPVTPVTPVTPVAPTPEPSCEDDTLGPDESDTDCGGICGSTCEVDASCRVDGDCVLGLFCFEESGRCTVPSCSDGVQNGDERLADCGGGCAGCPNGTLCNTGSDCQSQVCGQAGRCSAPNCGDGVRNGAEIDIDCGGACPDCPPGRACRGANDCTSGVCGSAGCAANVAQCCQAPTCTDGVLNGGEPVEDCGNLACGLCPLESPCTQSAQCDSGACRAGVCVPLGTCTDNLLNGTETATDCGGGNCPVCADRRACNQPSDCFNNNCLDGICISCGDNFIDGTETDLDCGGSDPACQRCRPGQRCLIGSDCQSGQCFGGFC
ncbi:MAG TPA: hypothetical protein VJU61_11095 [Polyangiaceae bacterium]|nr:hypothetical protein [Polyangiaceae bacterium]